jgi:hypothetical protein
MAGRGCPCKVAYQGGNREPHSSSFSA